MLLSPSLPVNDLCYVTAPFCWQFKNSEEIPQLYLCFVAHLLFFTTSAPMWCLYNTFWLLFFPSLFYIFLVVLVYALFFVHWIMKEISCSQEQFWKHLCCSGLTDGVLKYQAVHDGSSFSQGLVQTVGSWADTSGSNKTNQKLQNGMG